MESYGPKTCFGKVLAAPMMDGQRRLTPAQQTCRLGVRILQDTFRVHESSRAAIVEQLLNLVVTRASTSSSHYIGMSCLAFLLAILGPRVGLFVDTSSRDSLVFNRQSATNPVHFLILTSQHVLVFVVLV